MTKPFFHRDRKDSMEALPYCIEKLKELGKIKDYKSAEWVKKGHPLYGFDRNFKVDGFYTDVENPQLEDWIPVAIRSNLKGDDGEYVNVKVREIEAIKRGEKTGYKFIAPQKFFVHDNCRGNIGSPTSVFIVDSEDISKAYDKMCEEPFLSERYTKDDPYDDRHYYSFPIEFIERVTGKKVWCHNELMKFK